MNLYQLATAYQHDAAKLADLDLPDDVIADTLESMSGDLELKATNTIMVAKNLRATANAIKEAEAKMATRRKAMEARADALDSVLQIAAAAIIDQRKLAIGVGVTMGATLLVRPTGVFFFAVVLAAFWIAAGLRRGTAVMAANGWDGKFVPVLTFNRVKLYLACNPAVPDATIEKLNTALEGLIKDGTARRIDRKYDNWAARKTPPAQQ